MVACSALWKEKTGVEISWDKRSLQDFESFPLEQLARTYDLIVIDHPHVGQVTAENCLMPLDVADHETERTALAAGSVGQSYPSYTWDGRQWAFPIDAAAQVQAWRPDLIPAPPATWDAVLELARAGRVLLPLRPPHSLMVFFTLTANLGHPCGESRGADMIDVETGTTVLAMMREIAALVDPACFEMDPIPVLERMAAGGTIACAPLIYGYVSYAIAGFRPHRLAFSDIPVAGTSGPVGSAVGGTGIAVSARTEHPDEAIAFAHWIAGEAIQRGPYAAAGGQPGHAVAWEDEAINKSTGSFYANTRATLEGGWIRPRHHGYVAFQAAGSAIINTALQSGEDAVRVIADFNEAFRGSFR